VLISSGIPSRAEHYAVFFLMILCSQKKETRSFFMDALWAVARHLVNNNNLSQRQVSRDLGITRRTVARWLQSSSPPSHGRRPPQLSSRKQLAIKRRLLLVKKLAETTHNKYYRRGKTDRSQRIQLTYKGFPTAKAIVVCLARRHRITVSVATVTRDLHKLGFQCKARPTRPLKVVGDAEHRLAFCCLMKRQTESKLKKIVFSDETLLTGCTLSRRDWTRSTALPRVVDQNCPRIMFWGAIGYNTRLLIPLERGSLDADLYVERVLRQARHLLTDKVFQFDNARCHIASTSLAYLRRAKIQTLEDEFGVPWPVRSPTLSPIEQAWGHVKRLVSERHPTTAEELQAMFIEEWNKVPVQTMNRFVTSFRAKVSACIERRGEA
jgi:transposase